MFKGHYRTNNEYESNSSKLANIPSYDARTWLFSYQADVNR